MTGSLSTQSRISIILYEVKLYLSSYLLGNATERLVDLLGTNKTAAIIMNATDVYGDSRRPEYFLRYKNDLSQIGINGIDVDLRKYFSKSDELLKVLTSVGLIWVCGGNTFTIRRAMRETKMDQFLPDLLANNEIVYGGFSAGVCVLSPSLRGIHLGDEPERIAAGYPSEVIWEGLNLIDFYVVPHYRSPHPETEAMELVSKYYEDAGVKYYNLRDGEALVINNSKVECVGVPNTESTFF